MEPPIFFAPPENVDGERITLPPDESHHLSAVLRLKQSAIVVVVDGLGMAYRCEVVANDRSSATVHIHTQLRNFGEPAVRLTLAAGMSVGSKFDIVVEKGTELGVKRFVPIISEKSKIKFEDQRRAARRVARLEKVALAAMKQCRRSYRPDITTPTSVAGFLEETDHGSLNLVFHPSPKAVPLSDIEFDSQTKRASLLVGPESGFSNGEVDLAVQAGFRVVSLGPRILRAETAGPVVSALVMQALGELR
ncbi:MAG: 16S rRNA (uracil(1498)-N(3))-methyltransferase [Candidatus Zixiibacteriota bacterium]|jgi:16S rRNA (uracil1498-N3)-methyltransferase